MNRTATLITLHYSIIVSIGKVSSEFGKAVQSNARNRYQVTQRREAEVRIFLFTSSDRRLNNNNKVTGETAAAEEEENKKLRK